MAAKLKWGILGTGGIAKRLAGALAPSTTGELIAVGSRTVEAASQFAAEFKVPRAYGSYAALVADPEVQAVYISLPNHLHAEWTIRCARAGKHILCEKPFTSNYPEAMAVIEEVRRCGVFQLEAFMYRCHPQTARIVELVKSKVIGEVRLIHANFSFNFGEQPDNIRSKCSTSGGGIMDVGCYTMSFVRLIAGAALGLEGPAEPLDVKGVGHLNPQGGVDTWALANLKFAGDILASLTCGMQVGVPLPSVIFGSRGRIVIHNPWFPGETPDAAKLEVHVDGQKEPQILSVPGDRGLYTIEVDLVAKQLADKQAPTPAMTWADSLGNMKALDAWRKSIGLVFDCEKPAGLTQCVGNEPLRIPQQRLPAGHLPGVEKPVSRIIMGTMYHVIGDLPKSCVMLDHYVQAGGNALDTAYVYGTEANVGQWLKSRGLRDHMFLIGKGAADIKATPAMVTAHLTQSLERLQTDYVDLFLMHRDNPDVPVGEFVDVLNTHLRAGRVRAFGGSNWTPARLQAANDYAAAHGLTGFAASSPNCSLAAWNEPMWADCVNVAAPEAKAWYASTQLPLLAWSSQANGFFSGRFAETERDNPALANIVRVWFNAGNFERLRRVQELARRKHVTGMQIALAWVLRQPLNIFAMIGPESLAEMRESLVATHLELSPQELAWLNLEA